MIDPGSTLLAAFCNVFITGSFYTGFLAMYGISITGAGIVTFIPYIADIFPVFSAKVLSRFRRRKPILAASKIFIAHAVYAPFAPGFSVWFCNVCPKDNARRARCLMLCEVFRSIMGPVYCCEEAF